MKKIGIEEHVQPICYTDYLLSRKELPRLEITEDESQRKFYREWSTDGTYMKQPFEGQGGGLNSVGEKRLSDMDKAGIDMQVLSFPGGGFEQYVEAPEAAALAVKINDELYLSISQYPDRFAGFATLAINNPGESAKELERAVKQLGFKGTMISPHVNGEYIDAKKYWPIFERAAKLGVPVYIHPSPPAPDSQHRYDGYPELSGAVWGYAAEAGLAAMRLICSGIFDEYPDLKIILGHMGEALPFWMSRIDSRMLVFSEDRTPRRADGRPAFTPLATVLKKPPSQYITDNFFITTSGVMWSPALLCSLLALGAEKILFAADYPFESVEESVQAIEMAPISNSDKEKIFHSNAERLLGL